MVLQAVVLAIALASVVDQSTSPQTPAPATPATPGTAVSVPVAANRPHEDMAGSWSYNPDQSVNAATGRPETLRAANERRGGGGGGGGGGAVGGGGGPRGGPGGASTGPPPGYGAGADGRTMGGGYDGPPSVAFSMMQQSRDTVRDLMEIAPSLTIAVSGTNVTFTDDLKRTLVFPTDGKKQKYQLGAATFDAKTYWDGSQLKMDIEGPNSLKMTETFLLSEDGSRLFVLIRVGEQLKGERPVGVNRVYDRVVK